MPIQLIARGLVKSYHAGIPGCRARVDVLGPGRLKFILKEGRNRQIRRMCELVGLRVMDLLRVRIGPLALGDLP